MSATTPTPLTTLSPAATTDARRVRRTPLFVHIAAWAVPVMVLGQFAMLAIVPVAIVLIASFANARVRALRWYAGLLAVLYATPLVIWIVRPDGAQSLSKDIHPVFVALIAAAAVALLLKIYTRGRR